MRSADDAFYANHPELVRNGKRIPLSATDPNQAKLRSEWEGLYEKHGGNLEGDKNKMPPKKPDDPVQQCPLEEKNWIELEYLYCDGTGVADAHYRVINNDDGGVVAQGLLDGNGYAWCELPPQINNVSYDFDNDPPTIEYLKQPIANPELPKVKAGWFERMRENIVAAGSWTWGTIQGDFNEDQTVGQVATNAVITMIPIVDQVGDVRDIVANLKFLIWDKRYNDKWVWIALVLTLIGLIPVLGSAAKGVLKTVAKALKTSGKVPLKLLIEVLNKFHKGNAVKWLRKLAADLPSHAVTIKGMFRDILKSLRGKLKSLADILPGSLGKQADDAVNSIDEVAKIADDKIDEAVKELQDGLNKSLDEGVDFETKGATKSKNARKQTDAEPPDLPSVTVSPKMRDKILDGEVKPPKPPKTKPDLIGGHSPKVLNSGDYKYSEVIQNADGTFTVKKLSKKLPDGTWTKGKKNPTTIPPRHWSDDKIIETTESVSGKQAYKNSADGSTFHKDIVDGVEWEVVKNNSGEIVASYPTGQTPK